MRILSGMQPSGKAHIGNYLGAMREHVKSQEDGNECIYMLVNLHALTTVKDGDELRKLTLDLALDYLALGIDPEKTIFFKQGDVPEHAELTWIFNCFTHMGVLERAHAWKDAKQKGLKDPSVGLFSYPLLMAADILLYQPEGVPVGKDQKQHLEIARDIAVKFNGLYGDVFTVPEPMIRDEVAVIVGTDGEKKMSKSYGNTIELFSDEKVIKKQIMGMTTDSTPLEEPKDPDTCNVFSMFSHFASDEEKAALAEKYRAGNFGYGDAKKALLEKITEHFSAARKRRAELEKNLDHVEEILADGARRAREIAAKTMDTIKEKTGLK